MKLKRSKENFALDIDIPDGVFVRSIADRRVFLKKSAGLYEVSEICLKSWKVEPLLANARALDHYKVVGKLGFRDGTLVRDFADGRIFLISNAKKRLITDPRAFEQLGGDARTEIVPSSYIEMHEDGEQI